MSFQKLAVEDLHRIRPLLESKLPISAMMLNIFDMTLSGKYPDEDNVKIYGFNDVPDTDSMFLNVIIKAKDQDVEYSIIYAPETVTEAMLSAFSNLHDWTKIHDYGATPKHFAKHLDKLVDEKGGTLSKNPADDMYLPMQIALELNLDRDDHLAEEFELDKLSPEYAAKVNAHWKYGSEGYNSSIADAIRSFGGAGIFVKNACSNSCRSEQSTVRTIEDLVSWVILMRLGTLNALHTLDNYRHKGLGRWTLEAASKWVAQEGLIPLCEIEPYNTQSRSLVEKIGYKLVQEVYWMRYSPPAH